MRRWTLPVGIGLALGVAAIVALLAVSTATSRTPAQRAEALAGELRCPDCQGLSVADSPTRSAQEIRRQIDELLAGGATDDEVRDHFTARYGEWIRLAPSSPVLWLIPFLAVIAGVVALIAWLPRRSPGSSEGPALSEEERRKVRDEVEALDA